MADSQPALSVRVPASTSNVGPGFDLFGIALSVWLDARVVPISTSGSSSGDTTVLLSGAAAQGLPDGETNLLVIAFERARAELGFGGRFSFRLETEIPSVRGLGSSGASIAAGLLLANALAETPLEASALLRLGVELEGHPENVGASLFGGAVLCHPEPTPGAEPLWFPTPIDASIGFAIAWPDVPLPTSTARAALPEQVSFAEAVDNPRRLALLLEGLRTGAPELIEAGSLDRLHVSHRLALIEGGRDVLAAARAAGAWLATVSGAGSALLALGPNDAMPRIAEAMQESFRSGTGAGTGRVVEVVPEPPTVVLADSQRP